MNCPQCDTASPADAKFCFQCGAALATFCSECQALLLPQAKFCSECGTRVGARPSESSQPQQDALAARFQRLVPKTYAERLLATRGSVGRERRTVTILFCDVKGSTAMAEGLDPEDVMEIMDGAFDVLIEPVYHYEGTVARLMGDAILAFFGAPIAHEDDPERAIRAALAMVEGVQEYATHLERNRGHQDFGVRVGINTGRVVVGEVGSDLRVEYTAMGDAVNLAARMEQNAPLGGILITHETYRNVRGVFDVLPQELLQVKGRLEPVQTYLVQRAKPRAFRKPSRGVEGVETRMVGREAEFKHLQESFHSTMEDGELQMVTVCGEAGVGKSRLLHEFDLWAELQPEQFYYFKGRSSPEMQNQPYSLIRDLIAFRFEIEDSDHPEVVREKLEAGVAVTLGPGEGSQRSAHTIGYLAGFALGESRHLTGAQDDAQQFRDQALACMGDYFAGLADRSPVLILLEDLHWADDSSLDALNHLALNLISRRVMIACAARPALFERRPHWGEGQAYHGLLSLEPLSRWDSRRLVVEILQKVGEVPQVLRDLVVAGTEGNPFFIEELIKMLVDDGAILVGEDRWDLDLGRLSEIRVPPTLTGVLQARLDRLPPGERTVLQQASVVGRLFWDRAIFRVDQSEETDTSESAVAQSLASLRSRELVFQRETSSFAGAREYIFKHALLREITYQGVLKRVRRAYHGLVADWLLEQGGERVEEFTALIADHLELAGRAEEAVGFLLQAGDRARILYAHQEAIPSYERALALLKVQGDDERAARTLMRLGLAYHIAFDFRRARQAYEDGFALWQQATRAATPVPLPSAPHALREGREDPQSLDPAHAYDFWSGNIVDQLFCGLVELTPELSVVPGVAKSWEVSRGGRQYLFHLRDDAIWSDGVPLTAHDFARAWERVLDPATGCQYASLLYAIKGAKAYHQGLVSEPGALGVRALDGTTLLVELEAPTVYLLHLLADTVAFPVPRHVLKQHGAAWTGPKNIVGNGPFILASWTPGKSMVLERNPRYHGRFGGNVQRVEITPVAGHDWRRRLEMYEADLADIGTFQTAGPKEMDRLRQRRAGEYMAQPGSGVYYLVFDVTQPPFDDPRLRRALAYAADRDALVYITLGGYGFPATGGFVPLGMPGHTPGIALPHDVRRGRQLLAEAGYPSGRGFPETELLVHHGHEAEARDLSTAWQEHLGVEIRCHVIPWDEWIEQVRGDRPCTFLSFWMADYPDPDNYLRMPLALYSGWSHETYWRLIEQARQVTEQGARMALYARAEQILVEEVPILPLSYGRQHLLVKPWVKRYPVSAMYNHFWKDVVIEPH